MNFSIVFSTSGDELPFTAINPQAYDLLLYYVEQLEQRSTNSFSMYCDTHSVIAKGANQIDGDSQERNEVLSLTVDSKSLLQSNERTKYSYLDQQFLNELHATWVQSKDIVYDIRANLDKGTLANHIHSLFPDSNPTPTLQEVITQLGLTVEYNKINLGIHAIEKAFTKGFRYKTDKEWFEVPNPFPKELATNSKCNFRLGYHHYGRPLYGKFTNFDLDLQADDENTFNELLGVVDVTLAKPESIPFSTEYTDWCNSHDITPTGENLNIGNIDNLSEKLLEYRKILHKNRDTFSIVLQ